MAPRPIVGPERTGHWGDLHRSREFYVYTYGLVGKQAWGFARLCFVLIFFWQRILQHLSYSNRSYWQRLQKHTITILRLGALCYILAVGSRGVFFLAGEASNSSRVCEVLILYTDSILYM